MALGLGKIKSKHVELETIERKNLEYPTTDVTFSYLACIGKLNYDMQSLDGDGGGMIAFLDDRVWKDKAVEAWMTGTRGGLAARVFDNQNAYQLVYHDTAAATKDNVMWKWVGGSWTELASEAVDLVNTLQNLYWAQCVGTELLTQRPTGTTRLTATDTSITEGRYGVCAEGAEIHQLYAERTWLRDPHTPSPRSITYFDCPVIGSGTRDDPFRAKAPEDIVRDNKWGDVNRLALTHSNLIKTGSDGKPVDYRALVRIFEQPDRQKHIRDVTTCINKLKAMRGVKKLDKDKAKREALKLDDKLKMEDLSEW